MQTKENLLWILFGFSAIGVGLYPISYSFLNFRKSSLLQHKTRELIANAAYVTAFYIHITLGGITLLTGWSQFIKSWRYRYPTFHGVLGYVYVISVFVSSISGLMIAPFSSGGAVAAIGFGALAVWWFISNLVAFLKIKKGIINEHQKWMIRNYTLTFSAVVLRICLPILLATGHSIMLALQIVSWLCWVPNVVVMEIYIQSRYNKGSSLLSKCEQKLESTLGWMGFEVFALNSKDT